MRPEILVNEIDIEQKKTFKLNRIKVYLVLRFRSRISFSILTIQAIEFEIRYELRKMFLFSCILFFLLEENFYFAYLIPLMRQIKSLQTSAS